MRSLRGRLFAYLALAVLASTVLTVGVAAGLTRHRIEGQRLAALERQADAAAAASGGTAEPARAAPTRVLLLGGPERRGLRRPHLLHGPRADRLLARIPARRNASGGVALPHSELLYAARDTPAGRIVLARPAGLGAGDWRPFAWSIVLAGAGGAAVAGLLAFFLARRLTRPLEELSAATRRVASGGVAVPVRGHDELARLAGAFNEMAAELERAREAQRSFLLSVSHELKTPLTAIRGYAEAVEEGAVDPREGTAVIEAEAARLERLVRDLLELARLDRREFSVEREPVDLAEVAGRAVERYAPRAAELEIGLGVEGPGPAWVLADGDRLLQVVSNLVENALRSVPAGGSVAIEVAPAALTVRDSGPGLAAEDLPRAFERFYLHDRYRSQRPVGSGLGLAIVKELVGAMGGTVAVASPPGGGATFTVRLPPTSVPAAAGAGAA